MKTDKHNSHIKWIPHCAQRDVEKFGEENGYVVEENWFEQDGSTLHKSRVPFALLQAKVLGTPYEPEASK